jgi:tRNA G18 (ribose-2'-O)-methylase SpoU
MIIEQITSLDDKELHPYRTLRRPLDHLKEGIFVAEGDKVVTRLLRTNIELVSLLCTPERFSAIEPIVRHRSVTVFLGGKELLETIVGYNLHQGIMAIGKVPAAAPMESFLSDAAHDAVIVALDGLANSENVGVVVRNCVALGVSAMVVGETSSSPYLRRAVRNSMGTVFKLPVYHAANLAETIRSAIRPKGFRTLAADPSGQTTLGGTALQGRLCIVFGSEGTGLTPGVLDACDDLVAIPMANDTDSLNVASASAVILYEAYRRRSGR